MWFILALIALLALPSTTDSTIVNSPLNNLLQELNQKLQPLSNVYVIEKQYLNVIENVIQYDYPNIILDENGTNGLPADLNSKLLIIKSLSVDKSANSFLENVVHLKALLKHISKKYLDVLFVVVKTDANITQKGAYDALFSYCWEHGFGKVLLTDIKGTLLTYYPFPRPHVFGTTLQGYMKNRENWKDLKGYFVNISFNADSENTHMELDDDDEIDVDYDEDTVDMVRYVGPMPKLLDLVLNYFNGTTERKDVEVTELVQPTEACLQSLSEQSDLCSNSLYYPQYSNDNLNYELLNMRLESIIVYNINPDEPEESKYLLAPFTAELWLLVVATCAFVACMLALVHRIQTGGWNFGRYILASIMFPINLWVNFRFLRGRSKHVLSVFLFVMGFIISNFYLARLSSIRTIKIYGQEIKTLKDVMDSNIHILISPYEMDYIANSSLPNKLKEKFCVDCPQTNLGVRTRNSLEGHPEFAKLLKTLRGKLVSPPLLQVPIGIPVRKGYPLQYFFERIFRNVFDNGLYKLLEREYQVQKLIEMWISEVKEGTVLAMTKPLTLEYFRFAFMLLGCGLSLAFIVFLFELNEAQRQRKFAEQKLSLNQRRALKRCYKSKRRQPKLQNSRA